MIFHRITGIGPRQVCLCMCVRRCPHVYVYELVCMRACVYGCVHLPVQVWTCVGVCTCMCAHVSAYVCTCVCLCVRFLSQSSFLPCIQRPTPPPYWSIHRHQQHNNLKTHSMLFSFKSVLPFPFFRKRYAHLSKPETLMFVSRPLLPFSSAHIH